MIKKIVLITIMFFFLSIFSACNTSTQSKELNLVISGMAQSHEKSFFRTFIKLFEAETGISVNLSYITSNDLKNQIQTEITNSNVVSDVVMVDTANMSTYVEQGWMTDISGYMNDFSDRTVIDLFSEYTSKDEEMYFVPVSFDLYISIYNKLALPFIPSTIDVIRDENDQIIQISSITWEEFAEWGNNISEITEIAKTGFPMAFSSSQLLYPMGGMALAFGSESFPKVNDRGAIEAWNLIASMAAAGSIVDESILSTVNQPESLLSSGTLWMSFGHMGPIGMAYDANPSQFVLGPTPISEETETAGSTAGAWAFGIVDGAPNEQSSKTWIEFMTDPEINYLYCSGLGGVISPIEEVIDELGDSNTDKIMSIGLASYQATINIAILDTSRYSSWTSVKSVYIELYQRLLTGVPLTQEEANAFQTQIDVLVLLND